MPSLPRNNLRESLRVYKEVQGYIPPKYGELDLPYSKHGSTAASSSSSSSDNATEEENRELAMTKSPAPPEVPSAQVEVIDLLSSPSGRLAPDFDVDTSDIELPLDLVPNITRKNKLIPTEPQLGPSSPPQPDLDNSVSDEAEEHGHSGFGNTPRLKRSLDVFESPVKTRFNPTANLQPAPVDLTDEMPVGKEAMVTRLSSLQAEKIGILEKKVRSLVTKLRTKYNDPAETPDEDLRLKRVEDRITTLNFDDENYGFDNMPAPEPQNHGRTTFYDNMDDNFDSQDAHQMGFAISSPQSPFPPRNPPQDFLDNMHEPPAESPYFNNSLDEPPLSQGSTKYPWSKEIKDVLRTKFGLMTFRGQQKDIVDCTLSGKDAIVLMPTGGGKSLCYQLPALCDRGSSTGTTVVISPLISLMQDQVYHLKNRDIEARMINSSLSSSDRESAFHDLANNRLRLVYLSPEMLSLSSKMKNELLNLYKQGKLARLVIDEAHCVSSWGHDFREDYLKLDTLKDDFPNVPIMALTGTANTAVLSDISRCVRPDQQVFKQSFNRPNLYYEVKPKTKEVMQQIKNIVRAHHNRTGIIFCHSQMSCQDTAEKLIGMGISAGYYHAGLPKEKRQELQEQWQEDKIKVMCATIAFGMGVDKPDVRFVVHLTLPRTMEGFYQESGRAGRDGQPSSCTIFYSPADYNKLFGFIDKDDLPYAQKQRNFDNLARVKQYCENNTDCRRKQILQYFEEIVSAQICRERCDTCQKKRTARMIRRDMTNEAKVIVQLLEKIPASTRITILLLIDILRGSRIKRILENHLDQYAQYGKLKNLDKTTVERLVNRLSADKVLQEYSWSPPAQRGRAAPSYTYLKLGEQYRPVLQGTKMIVMDFMEELTSSIAAPPAPNKRQTPDKSSAKTGAAAQGQPKRARKANTPSRFQSATQKNRKIAAMPT